MNKQFPEKVHNTKTLETISNAKNFNEWMYQVIARHCNGQILEIGCGIGNISEFFIHAKSNITLIDINNSYLQTSRRKFGNCPTLHDFIQFDFAEPNIEYNYPNLINQFDTIFALNVLEHIPNHKKALHNANKMLKPGGKLIILVPAFQCLFNQFDEKLDHQRRYSKTSLQSIINGSGFYVTQSQYFNCIGILGWFISGNILQKKQIPKNQMKLYNFLVPLWKIIDRVTSRWLGLSLIQVAIKK